MSLVCVRRGQWCGARYLGPLGAGTALLALLVVLPAGTAVLSTPMSSLAERKCPEVRARCFVGGLWQGQDFLFAPGGGSPANKSGTTALNKGDFGPMSTPKI